MSMNHPDKLKTGDGTYFNQLTMMRNILSDSIYANMYDNFGEFVIPEKQSSTF